MSGGVTRRGALGLFSAGAAALVAGCRPSWDRIVPYREMPEGMVPGQPLFFATSLPLGGAGRGVIVESHEGRPTKVHGLPDHPASLGATDVFAEAAVLGLFDPYRSSVPRRQGLPASWTDLAAALSEAGGADGAGLAILTGPVGSPTMARQLRALLEARPRARWAVSQPVQPALTSMGAQLWPDFTQARFVVSLGADPLGPGPGQPALARNWAAARRAGMRSLAFEAQPTLTGAACDRRRPARPSDLPRIAAALAGEAADAPEAVREAAAALASGGGMVLPGPDLPPEAQAQVARLNERLGAPLRYLRPFSDWDGLAPGTVDDLRDRMAAGGVRALVVIGANPVYHHGGDFAAAMARVPASFHFGTGFDETAEAALWHGPLHHPLEDWSDLRAVEGTVGTVQPLIAPLHQTRSSHEVLDMLARPSPRPALEIVQQTWREAWGAADFDDRWLRALHDGVIAGTGPEEVAPRMPARTPERGGEGAFEVARLPSPSVYDGAFAGNAWLQECPQPFSKQVWGNAVLIADADARRLGIETGDMVELSGGDAVFGPALVSDLQAEGSVGLHLGYGRPSAGPIGTAVGFRAAGLAARVSLRRTGAKEALVRTQTHFDMKDRDIIRTVRARSEDVAAEGPPPPTLYPDYAYPETAWGMVIDTDACIGCNACMIACQAENNVPVVGAAEVAKERNMHWLRVDSYDLPEGGRAFQPVPCMHCEKAPCEPVCPTAASVHDSEGLNAQVYNRCIGTRFCQANCPYKVRRFNFFDYAGGETVESQGHDLLRALRNPDVSVRARGVMEKCTYCVQRISGARRAARKEGRDIADGEVVTACQAACPTEAITFGNLADPGAAVSAARADPRHYALLEHLGTRPRTTYLARVVPEDGEDEA